MSSAPLADVRVLALEQYGAGPWATLQLADLGAEVIKIEDPASGGDVGRYVPPYQDGENSLFFESFNRNKRSISLDLRQPGARGVFEDLALECDAIFSNLRGDQVEKLRLRYDDLKHVNTRLVCCSLSGFGATGPRVAEGAYDWTVQGLAGWQAVTGEPGGPPTKSGLSLADYTGGYVAAIALLGAVWRARRDGIGGDIDLSLFEVALAQLAYLGTWVASRGYLPVRRPNSAHQTMVPFQNFETSDGWIVIACPKQALWERFAAAIGRGDLAEDERFRTFALRHENREELLPMIERELARRTTSEWLAALTEVGIPAARVNDVAAALADPQAVARDAVVETEHPVLGRVRQVATPLRIASYDPPTRRAPFRGEDTLDVLRGLCHYDDATIAALRSDGVFGETPAGVPS